MYKLISPKLVLRLSDGAVIPDSHPDWSLYAAWVAAGNSPDMSLMIAYQVDMAVSKLLLKLSEALYYRLRHLDEQAAGETPTLSAGEHSQLLLYLIALRDVPAQPGFPGVIDWPVKPEFVK